MTTSLDQKREMDTADREISVRDIARLLWAGRQTITRMVGIGLALGILYLMFAKPTYTAKAVVVPVNIGSNTGQGLQQLSGIASLVDVNLPGQTSVTNFDRFQKTLTSVRLARHLAQDQLLLRALYPAQWDIASRHWARPSGLINFLRYSAGNLFGRGWQPPDAQAVAAHLKAEISISSGDIPNIVTISYDSRDRDFAVRFLTRVIQEADLLVKRNALNRTSQYVQYAEKELDKRQSNDQRNALIELLVQQDQTMMMLNTNLSFSAEFVDPPNVSDQPTAPRVAPTLLVALMASTTLGVLLVIWAKVIDALRGG